MAHTGGTNAPADRIAESDRAYYRMLREEMEEIRRQAEGANDRMQSFGGHVAAFYGIGAGDTLDWETGAIARAPGPVAPVEPADATGG